MVTYHGEPSPEVTAAIWSEAARRYPTEPTHQSAFNDGCHWLVQRMKAALAEYKRLSDIDERMKPWTDTDARTKHHELLSTAYHNALKEIAGIVGDDTLESLWYGAPEANDPGFDARLETEG